MTPMYTWYDVTGDGRCYFYAILKALDLPLYKGKGKINNTKIGLNLIDSNKREQWETRIQYGRFADPIDVLDHSKEMCKMLYRKGINFIAKLIRTRTDFSEIESYLADPISSLLSSDENAVFLLHESGRMDFVAEISESRRPQEQPNRMSKINLFKNAFQEGRVVTFIWRHIRGKPDHYEIILPN